MAYSPHTEADHQRMLEAVGVASIEDLFADIPPAVRTSGFELPPPLTEQEVRAELSRLAGRNRIPHVSFLGAGAYRHLVPSVVMEVIGRSEFSTSYTPYQPEVSQGTLQSIYEFQSLICELTGMEVASASHYDGATATAEAALMACRLTRRHRVAVSTAVAPQVRQVLAAYCSGPGVEIVEVPADLAEGGSGLTPVSAAAAALDDSVACLVAQQPNFFGGLEPMRELAAAAHAVGAQLVAVVEPTSLAAAGAAGRLRRGHRGRRGAATGHPTLVRRPVRRPDGGAHGLGAPDARPPGRIHPGCAGAKGLRPHPAGARAAHPPREGGQQHLHQPGPLRAGSHRLPDRRRPRRPARGGGAVRHPGAPRRAAHRGDGLGERRLSAPYFAEVAIRLPNAPQRHAALAERGIVAGYPLGRDYPEMADTLLLAATELTTDDDVDALVDGPGGDTMSVAESPPDASGRGAAFTSPEAGEELTVVQPLIFESSATGRRAVRFPKPSDAARQAAGRQPAIPGAAMRAEAPRAARGQRA